MNEDDPKLDEFLSLLNTAVSVEELEKIEEDEEEELDTSLSFVTSSNTLWVNGNVGIGASVGHSTLSFTGGATFSSGNAFSTSHAEYLRGEEIEGQFVVEVKSELPVVIKTQNGEINLDKLAAMMTRMDEVFCVVEKMNADDPNFPALQTAYRHFRVVEAIARSTPPPEDGE
jgi:hypothetical protein